MARRFALIVPMGAAGSTAFANGGAAPILTPVVIAMQNRLRGADAANAY